MQTQAEQILIKKFVIKDKQERYLSFIKKERTRLKFTNKLHHFNDFDWNLFYKIKGSENDRELIAAKVNERKNILTCHVISANSEFDEKEFSVIEAIKNIVGEEGMILIFGDAEIVYYQAEAFDRRFISL